MRIGPLRDRVIIQERSANSQNAYGENTAGYTVKEAEVWAAIDDVQQLSGKKLVVAQQILAEGDHLVRMRYRDGIKPHKHRLKTVVGNRIFDVQSVVNLEGGNRELWFRCKETNPSP